MKYFAALCVVVALAGCSRVSPEEKAAYEKLVDASIMANAMNRSAFHQLFSEAQLQYGRFKMSWKKGEHEENHLDLAMTHAQIVDIMWDGGVPEGSARQNIDCLTRELALYKKPKEPASAGTCKAETIK